MATLHVRNVPEDVYEALRAHARSEGRSINAATIALLREALTPADAEALIEDLRRFRARTKLPEGALAPEEIIRRDRDAGHWRAL
jgi:plasmid stability protein